MNLFLEKLKPYALPGDMYNGMATIEKSVVVPQKIKIGVAVRFSNSTSECIHKSNKSRVLRCLYNHVCCNIFHSQQKVEATQIVPQIMNKQNVA